MDNPFSLSGKTILITGASSGIGRATAIECSKLGANLIITGRNEEKLVQTQSYLCGINHQTKVADLTSEIDLNSLIDAIGCIDGLVMCAGKGLMLPVQFSTRDKMLDVFDTNFFCPMQLLRMLLKKKKIKSGASVVGVASMGGTHFYTAGNSIYGASKAAFDSYMKFCAREIAPKNIRVNTVLPAMIDTPLIHKGSVSEEEHQKVAMTYPLKRYGKPEEVAYAIIYLLSDAAAWTTGTSLIIDGGKSLV